jgi:hypothetical protein
VVDFERPLTVSPYDGTSADTVYPQDDWQTGRSRLAPVVEWEIAVDDNEDIFIRALDSIDLTDRVFVYIYSSPASSIGNRALSSHDLFGIVDDVDLEAGKWTKLETDSDLYPSDEDAGDPRDTATVAEIRASWDAVIYSNLVRAPQNGVFLYSYADYVPGFSSSAPDPAEIALSINNRAVGDSTIQSIVPRLMSAKD